MGHNTIGREEAVRRLRAFSRQRLGEADIDYGEALVNETDRGAIILLATAIEDALEQRLKLGMVKLSSDESARLFGADAPLGSFSSKTKLAYALGYIDREAFRMIDLVRDMRNACAHSCREITFANEELRDVAKALLSYLTNEEIDLFSPLITRLYVTWSTGWLMRYIRTGSKGDATALIQAHVNDALADANEQLTLQKGRDAQRSPKGRSSRTN